MIRTKILHGKVDILLIEGLPEDAIIGIAKHGGFVYRIPVLLGEPLRYIIDLPLGNWQPVNWLDKISEDEAKELVDMETFYHYTGSEYFIYRDYLEPKGTRTEVGDNPFNTAKESLLSLVEANVKTRNKHGHCPVTTDEEFINKWFDEEAKVWKNIYLFRKTN